MELIKDRQEIFKGISRNLYKALEHTEQSIDLLKKVASFKSLLNDALIDINYIEQQALQLEKTLGELCDFCLYSTIRTKS